MKKYLLGLDNGGTACKAAVFDTAGNLVLEKSMQIPLSQNQNGKTERNPEDIKNANFKLIRQITDEFDGEIAAVGLSGHGKGLYMLDKNKNPLPNGIGSTDSRAIDLEIEFLKNGIAEKAYKLTYQKLLACQPALLLRWLKDNDRSVYNQIGTVFSVKDLVGFFLTDNICTDGTDISGSSLVNLNTKTYDPYLTDLYGISEIFECLPPIKNSFDIRGFITEDVAKATGLTVGTPVACGMFDIDACAIAAGCVNVGDMCMIAGTWSINEYITNKPVTSGISMNSLYCIENMYLAEESSATSAGNLEWVRKLIKNTDYNELETMVKNASKDSHLYFLPFLYASNLDPFAKACFVGLDSSHTDADIIKAVYEGVVFSGYTHLEKLLASCDELPQKIYLAGGVVHSKVWTQMFADIAGINLIVSQNTELGAMGGAMCAGVAAGIYASVKDAAMQCTNNSFVVKPNPSLKNYYQQKYKAYRTIEAALSSVWKEI